jgi:hypothetical protein
MSVVLVLLLFFGFLVAVMTLIAPAVLVIGKGDMALLGGPYQ